ncbi:programmed cell death protein 2 [Salmo salar]|uniref:Programmed cell death protein 2 n=1 Tax=Salmo salar TaxID=8030 RepID=B5XC48_SALSA|nr:programmed cell death protein 2 [Salmo salar]ACI68418.1 Programmed cell death protein 2 [Salmo salar]|eukprot:NP_001134666.1 programmed cell death protein 2 [Salmo salar]
MAETGVALGFLEEAEHWRLQSHQFPSKVGGKPAWLSQLDIPGLPELACGKCQLPTAFLLQVYAPITGQDRSFHRTLFVFCCKTPDCYSRNDSRCLKVFRCQLPRRNDFYPYNPPSDEDPNWTERDPGVHGSGVKLCKLCGCPGQKVCSKCHAVSYCSKEHQTIDWKHCHKKECCKQVPSSAVPSPFLFPELELVTEPEEHQKEESSQMVGDAQNNVECSSVDDLAETELEDMAMHETEDGKVFQKFKRRIASEPHQVLRYFRDGSPLWISSEHVPVEKGIPHCSCGSRRIFEFQVMPQLLNDLKVDSPDASIDWGTLAVYTCADSCDQGNKYSSEFIWKQDFTEQK